MGLTSFAGRVLFASVFILAAMQELREFGTDGGLAAKPWMPKFHLFVKQVSNNLGVQIPGVGIKHIVAAAILFKGLGGILFILGSSVGAYLLALHLLISTPLLYDFYNYKNGRPEFAHYVAKFTKNITLFGALLFFLGMKNSIARKQPKKMLAKTNTT